MPPTLLLIAQLVFQDAPSLDRAAQAVREFRTDDALALLTEWHEFRRPDFDKVRALLVEPVIFDGRNAWDPSEMRALGFTYYGIGRR